MIPHAVIYFTLRTFLYEECKLSLPTLFALLQPMVHHSSSNTKVNCNRKAHQSVVSSNQNQIIVCSSSEMFLKMKVFASILALAYGLQLEDQEYSGSYNSNYTSDDSENPIMSGINNDYNLSLIHI